MKSAIQQLIDRRDELLLCHSIALADVQSAQHRVDEIERKLAFVEHTLSVAIAGGDAAKERQG